MIDMATISSMCDQLQDMINDFGLRPMSCADADSVHRRTFPLLTTLRSMNANQGLGFVVYGTVVDRRTLSRAVVAVGGFLGTVVPVVIALQPDIPEDDASSQA